MINSENYFRYIKENSCFAGFSGHAFYRLPRRERPPQAGGRQREKKELKWEWKRELKRELKLYSHERSELTSTLTPFYNSLYK